LEYNIKELKIMENKKAGIIQLLLHIG